jgi:hypothetical protein
MTNEELKAMQTDATIGRVYMALGWQPTKLVTSYLRSAIRFVDNPDGTPLMQLVDPTNGAHYQDAKALAAALKSDPDFKPAARTSSGSSSEPPPPLEVNSWELDKLPYDPDLLKKVADGRIKVRLPENEYTEPKEGEVSVHDQRALNRNIEGIASGKVRVV